MAWPNLDSTVIINLVKHPMLEPKANKHYKYKKLFTNNIVKKIYKKHKNF
jgi:hypothetical protein